MDRPIGTMEDALLNIDLIADSAHRPRKLRPKVLQPLPDETVEMIPYEIIECILDQIRDRKTLSACSRVCYGWHRMSTTRLFSCSSVRLNTVDKIGKFLEEICPSSTKYSIIPYIQSISMSLDYAYPSPIRLIHNPIGLTSLHSLKLKTTKDFPLPMINGFSRNFGHIIDLDLKLESRFATWQAFVTFISSFPKIQRLAIDNCQIDSFIDYRQAIQNPPPFPQLRFLEIGDVNLLISRPLFDVLLLRWLIRAETLTALSIYHDDLTSMNHRNFSFAFKTGADRLKRVKIYPVRIADCDFSRNSRLEEIEFGLIDLCRKPPGSVDVLSHIMQQISSHSIKTLIFTFEIAVVDDLDAVDWVGLCRALKDQKFASLSTGMLEFRLNRLIKNASAVIREKLSSLAFPFRVCPNRVSPRKRRFESFPLE